jgi:hypothetical protein
MGMNSEKFSDLEVTSAAALEKFATTLDRKLEAREVVRQTMEDLKRAGEALELSDEEIRLLQELRKFKASCKPGAVFKWQTQPSQPGGVIIGEDTALIEDPQRVK